MNAAFDLQDKLLNKLDEHEPELAGSQDEEVRIPDWIQNSSISVFTR